MRGHIGAAWTGTGECDYETVPLCTVMLDVCYCVAAAQQRRSLLTTRFLSRTYIHTLTAVVISPKGRHFTI